MRRRSRWGRARAASVAERVKERILNHADKVLDLQCEYEEAREAWVQACIDDAVQRALEVERGYVSALVAAHDVTRKCKCFRSPRIGAS